MVSSPQGSVGVAVVDSTTGSFGQIYCSPWWVSFAALCWTRDRDPGAGRRYAHFPIIEDDLRRTGLPYQVQVP